jgi:RHS repeat-associated protein
VANAAGAEVEAVTRHVTKYYYFNGQRVAMRQPDDEVVWLHGDHLGSTSLTTNESMQVVARQLYKPFGEVRWVTGTLGTDFGFTGQREDVYIKLVEMGARWYDPQAGRWTSPDTIIPDPANPQSLNRYSYVNNRVLRYVDPTGHFTQEEIMEGFGVGTWDEVLAFFEAGGGLEGLWGWLELLRRAAVGDRFEFIHNYWWDSQGMYPILEGEFQQNDSGGIFILGREAGLYHLLGYHWDKCSAFYDLHLNGAISRAADLGGDVDDLNFYSTSRAINRWINPYRRYMHYHYSFDVNWTEARFDAAGLLLSPFQGHLAGIFAGLIIDTVEVVSTFDKVWKGDATVLDLVIDYGGMIPIFGGYFDAFDLLRNTHVTIQGHP